MPAAVASATYDASNEVTTFGSVSETYDANGNLTSDGTDNYTWNARDQLAVITGGTTASFVYDGVGRRRSKTIAGRTSAFLYDQLNPVQELSGGIPTANLLTGLTVDEYFTRNDGQSSYFAADGLGSTIA